MMFIIISLQRGNDISVVTRDWFTLELIFEFIVNYKYIYIKVPTLNERSPFEYLSSIIKFYQMEWRSNLIMIPFRCQCQK